MESMSVTLDVSKLSGWLNADCCRVRRGGVGGGRHEGKQAEGWAGWSVAQAAGRPSTVKAEGRARAEHTRSMCPMSVTLNVSKLSGWLNTDARCRVRRGSIEGGVTCRQPRREGGVGWSVAQAAARPPTVEAEGRARAERTRNMDAMFVTLDVSKLSGWLNTDAPCQVERGSLGGATCGL